jgi:hypothetical protein
MQPDDSSPGPRPRSGLAITSLVLGIVGNLCLGPIAGIPAVIAGHVALGRARRLPAVYGGAGLAIAGLVLGYVSFVVGLAMMAILAGLTLPALAKAKGQAQSISCINNLKQLGLAARIYATDNDDRYPTNLATLGPLVGAARVFVCPADSGRQPLAGTNWSRLEDRNVSYEFLTPGGLESEIADQPAFRCPRHGHVALGNGLVVKDAEPPRSP